MGAPLDEFRPSRGLRQGDPISPYLFLLAAEGLSGLLKQSRQSSHLKGLQVAPTAPAVNHLLFADDSLLFVKANVEGATEVNALLDKYCNLLVSGLIWTSPRFSLARAVWRLEDKQ